ncbi:MAG TPA: hypothetical protein VMA75_01625 [Candidatus Paceibacterota bacterium]|nr:hypothetical protein [Candidatus Paceibacterota bacterium]
MAQRVAGEIYESVTGQLFEIGRQLRQPNGYPFDAQKLQRALQNAIEGKFDVTSVVQQYLVTVNYDLSVKDAIAAGRYDWKNDDITAKNFPSKRKGTADLEIILVKFDDAMSSEGILRELDKQGLRAAELPELLAFGEKYPDVQREFPVVALGSVWRGSVGNRGVPYLRGYAGKRYLLLDWFGLGWGSLCRFAAVRK